jgi:hypothetical protein
VFEIVVFVFVLILEERVPLLGLGRMLREVGPEE